MKVKVKPRKRDGEWRIIVGQLGVTRGHSCFNRATRSQVWTPDSWRHNLINQAFVAVPLRYPIFTTWLIFLFTLNFSAAHDEGGFVYRTKTKSWESPANNITACYTVLIARLQIVTT